MIAYIDTSVLMRIVLESPAPLAEWGVLESGVSSALLSVEGYRTIDRLWHGNELTEDDVAVKRTAVAVILPRLILRDVDDTVLEIASRPLPAPLRTLDAIHLATAMVYRKSQPDDERPILFATHDVRLGRAAAAMHFDVIGVSL